MLDKYCSRCKTTKPVSEFHKNRIRKDGLHGWCKVCNNASYAEKAEEKRAKNRIRHHSKKAEMNEISRNWYYKNREYVLAKMAQYQIDNKKKINEYQRKRSLRKKSVSIYYISDKEIKKLYDSSCIYCGSRNRIEIDHIIPIAKGGEHRIGNLVAACKTCNSSKNDSFLSVWKQRKKGSPNWRL